MKERIQIAIDGPSGAGKSTVAKAIAARMGIVYVDTGAMYRTVGLYCVRAGVDPTEESAVVACLPDIQIDVRYENGIQCVYLNGENPGDAIRTPQIAKAASAVSKIPAVRAFLLDTQRSLAARTSVIMDGRDIGTVILPQADVKIFMTASAKARAQRRTKELREKGIEADEETILREMQARDEQDANRAIAPAVPAKDAVLLDNSALNSEETVEEALRLIRIALEK